MNHSAALALSAKIIVTMLVSAISLLLAAALTADSKVGNIVGRAALVMVGALILSLMVMLIVFVWTS